MKYSQERKRAVLAKMRPPQQHTVAALAEREGISEATLYNWRSQAREDGQLLPSNGAGPVGWRSSDKFNAVLETAALSESETAQYCRRHGLYPEQIARWRTACAQANDRADRVATGERVALKSEKARRKRVERELRRKDAALAETAALLALRKKAQAIWGEDEDV
jgi:transposase-like protein